ncbi:MAG TPA: hypothetical protein VIS96_16125 [Terrimicrobiaceae bacterium]
MILGAAIFGLYAFLSGPPGLADNRIVVTPGIIENLEASFKRSSPTPPGPQERDKLIEAYIYEEVLNREAAAMGLHRSDSIVRSLLVRRMEFLNEDSAVMPPTDAELGAYFEKVGDRFRKADGRLPALAEVRTMLERAWMNERQEEARKAAYSRLRGKYAVVVQRPVHGPGDTALPQP